MSAGDRIDSDYMRIALRQAQAAFDEGEVPVGAVIVHSNRVIAKAHNQKECLRDPTAHAEMIAITQAAAELGNWCLAGCVMYVTLEPCPMCTGALVLARVSRLVIGARDPKTGACGSVMDLSAHPRLNHGVDVSFGVMADESSDLLKRFFLRKRMENN